jgi:predicted nucleic acid-binding protein
MTYVDAAEKAVITANRLSLFAAQLQVAAAKLADAVESGNVNQFVNAKAAFKRAARECSDSMSSVNDAELSLHFARKDG